MQQIFLIMFPGIGLIHLGETARGVLFFVLFAGLANLAFLAPHLTGTPGLRIAAAAGAGLVWVRSAIVTARPRKEKAAELES